MSSLDPHSILPKVLDLIPGAGATDPLRLRRLGGGSINDAYQVTTRNNKVWFCKINDAARFPDLFVKETQGLELLAATGSIRVPKVIACEEVDGAQVLVLEWIEEGARTDVFWTRFGEQLAALHGSTNNLRSSSLTASHPTNASPAPDPLSMPPSAPDPSSPASSPSDAPHFGLPYDNYMGALPQSNQPEPDWITFFMRHRLEPQVRLAVRNGLMDREQVSLFDRVYKALPGIFPETLPGASASALDLQSDPTPSDLPSSASAHNLRSDSPPPSPLHGDLWSGNFLCDQTGHPVLIDPAVYHGHPGVDLAMTTLFGGFDQGFYDAYNYHRPFPPNYRQQWEVCNLYPLLIHLNLFGQSYLQNILRTIQRF